VVVQVAIALRLGPRLAGTGLLTVAFCSPALLGPAVNALLWKATLHPGNGLLAQALRSLSLPGWANTITAPLMIGLVQTWTWGLAASAAVAVLFSGETAQARSLYLLDGGNPFWAELWALWATRREWLLLVILAISVENFRTYEITQVLTGGAFRTATFSFEVYETGFVVRNAQHEAIWAMLLLLVNGVATTLILRVLRAGRQA
jgi:ABC-type sugar transport system permease subunit